MKFLKKIKKFGFVLAVILVLVSVFAGYKIVQAYTGGGTATIADTTGTPGVESASAGVTAERGTSDVFTVVLTIDTAGMTLAASSPTFTVPDGFTVPTPHAVATAGDVNADGKWSVVAAAGSGTSGCTVSSDPGSSITIASGRVITVNITADCAVGNTITLTYKGTSNITMGATQLVVSTANAGDTITPTPLTAGSPTITVRDTIAPIVTIGSDKVTLKKNETAAITFTLSESSVNFTAGDVSVAGGTLSNFAGSGTSYTATFTPTDESTTLATINVATPTFTDDAGNDNIVATQKSMTVNTVTPTVTPEEEVTPPDDPEDEVIPPPSESHSSSGSIPVYGCKDPNATNYNYFSSSRPSLCAYADMAQVVTPPVVTPLLPNTGFPPQTWYESLINSFLNLFK